jgi:hypothetical protein
MKINTKQCTPMEGSPEPIVQSNKYILDDEQGVVLLPTSTPEPSAEDSNSDGGREKKYLPNIVYTPVLTSKRHHNQRRLLFSDDIDELNKKLSDLFLENKEDEEPPSATEAEESNEDNSVETEEESTAKDDPNVGNEKVSFLGRVYRTIFSYKTNKSSQALRSARHLE